MGTSEQNRTSGLKSLLLRAWRDRWSDVQWSIAVKRLLSSKSSENQHLAGMDMVYLDDMGVIVDTQKYVESSDRQV